MLKKLLTTIIVLAATATVWAEGWSVTYYIGGYNDAEIKKSADGKMTLADAIAEVNGKDNPVQKVIISAEEMSAEEVSVLANITQNHVDLSSAKGINDFTSLPACVKYVILPDGMTKEQVNNVGPRFDAAVSMGAHTKTVWRYNTYNTTGIEYTGVRYNETVVGGIAQATGKVSATVSISNPTTLYSGKVFYDNSGNAYQTSDDSKSVQLTAYTERYTYNNNGTTRLYPNSSGFYVVSEKGGYVGVQTSSTVTVEKKDVEYTYEKDGVTYEFVYNSYVPNLGKKGNDFYMLEGGSFVDIQTETKWMIDGKSDVYNEENGRLVTNNNIGHVGGTQIPLTKVSAYYVSGTNSVYEGPVRIDGENVYGRRDGGTPIELSLVYYYNDNGTEKEAGEGFYVSYDGKRIAPIKDDYGNNNGDWKPAKKEGDSWYIDYGGGYQLATNVTEDYVYKSIDGSSLYVNWNLWKIYNVSKYGYKYDGTSYEGQVYTEDGKYYGYTDGTEIKLENKITYVKDDNTAYDRAVYTYNNKYFGYDGGNSVELETSEYYTQWGATYPVTENDCKSEDGKKVYVGGTKTLLTPYNKEAYVITVSNVSGYSQNTLFTGRVYNETTGLIGGTETTVTYSAKGYCYNTDYIYTGEYTTKPVNNIIYGCIDDSVLSLLEAAYQYTYTDPINGETVVYETMEQESSVTVTHKVELTASEEKAGEIHLIAYVSIPGSLYYAIGDKHYGADDLTAVTLSGSLNYADIGNGGSPLAMNKYGHAKYDTYSYDPETNQTTKSTITPSDDIQEGAVENKNCAFTNVRNLQYIDFSDAKFNVNTDMQISGGMTFNIEAIKTVFLPTDPTFTTIPAGCFLNAKGVTEICIPKNIKIIEGKAFHNTALSHIYTTSDDEDVIVDNGTNTITLPAGLEEIRSAGNGSEETFSGAGMNKITDVHVLSEIAPKCSPYSFQGSMTFGNNGFEGNWAHPIGRHIYVNGKQMITVLHFPSSCTTEETKKYTDITRNYTLADETGAVDGKGKTIIWPRHAQFRRAFNQATMGYIWSDWDEYKGDDKEVIMEWSQEILKEQTTKYDRAYQGWHEFVLTGTSISQTILVQEETEFIQRDWYTLCVPYNLKKSHLLELFGIDKDKSTYNTVKMLKETESKDVTDTMYPDIRTITEISRSVSNGKMAIHLSKPLLNDKDGNNWEVVIGKDGKGFDYNLLEGEDPVIIKGGHPFLIRGYVPAAWNDKIKNLGMYIMAIAASDNSNAALEGKEEPYKYNDECLVNNVALPCVKHHIHARNFDYDENDEKNKNQFVFKDAAHTNAACYHFIGTYTETKIPQYAYYIGKAGDGSHKFSRTTKTTFKWAPYSAVIVGLNKPKYNDDDFKEGKTDIHNIIVGLDTPTNDLIILEGEDSARAGQALSIKFDENAFSGEATGITDININSNVNISNNKVYSINGQYMGTSLNNLPKGIYIINGQKKVVK